MAATDPVGPDLLARLRDRDPELLASLVAEHTQPLYRAARGMGFREVEAEDLVQDVFISFLGSLDKFEGRSKLRTWLFGILHNRSMEHFRKRQQDRLHDQIDELFESRFDGEGKWSAPPRDLLRLLESKVLGEAIDRCLDGLPPAQRSVFVLREMEGLETPEICKILDVTVTNLGVLTHRARVRLRECLEGRGWGRPE